MIGLFGQIKPKKGGRFSLEALLASGHAARAYLLLVGEVGGEERAWLADHAGEVEADLPPFAEPAVRGSIPTPDPIRESRAASGRRWRFIPSSTPARYQSARYQ